MRCTGTDRPLLDPWEDLNKYRLHGSRYSAAAPPNPVRCKGLLPTQEAAAAEAIFAVLRASSRLSRSDSGNIGRLDLGCGSPLRPTSLSAVSGRPVSLRRRICRGRRLCADIRVEEGDHARIQIGTIALVVEAVAFGALVQPLVFHAAFFQRHMQVFAM